MRWFCAVVAVSRSRMPSLMACLSAQFSVAIVYFRPSVASLLSQQHCASWDCTPEIAAVFAVCAALCLPSGKGAGRALLCALCAAGGYLLVTKGTEACLRLAGIAPNGIGNNAPEWKFVLGLDFSGSGSYSDRNGYVLGIADASLRRAEAFRIIRGSLAGSGHPVRFFLKKILGLWTGTAGVENALQGYYPTDTLFGRITAGAFERIASVCTRAVSPLLWAGAVLSVRPLFAPREKDRPLLVSLFAAAGLFLIFLLIEAQARYRYAAMPFACLLACPALSRIRLPSGDRKPGAGRSYGAARHAGTASARGGGGRSPGPDEEP